MSTPLGSSLAAVLLGLVAAAFGSWGLTRNRARSLSALSAAVSRLRRGEDGLVATDGRGAIGRLSENLNLMAAEIRDREQQITHLALLDAETGLGNRLSLERAITEMALAHGPQLFVAALGIDRFAQLRDAVGYAMAARIVRELGERLRGLHPDGAVARLSADTLGLGFAADDAAAAETTILRLLSQLEQPLHVGGDTVDVAVTIGLVQGGDGNAVIERASIGLDQARKALRKLAFFDPEAYGDPSSNLTLMSGMLWAIRSGGIELFYQPKFDLRSRSVNGVEGLVRWRHPTRGLLRPDLFIPMAEDTGHIRTLTDWVLRQAIADQAAMARLGHEVAVSVNISGRVLADRDFADFVDRTMPTAVGQICFEITETAVIENPGLALELLDRFRAAGVMISIDDFGAGLSSLAHLKQIPGDELKIDRSLIAAVTESQGDALMVRSTIDLAHSLGLKVTAVGVEAAAAFQLLTAMGCDSIQGYLIAKPQPLNELMIFLREDGAWLRGYG